MDNSIMSPHFLKRRVKNVVKCLIISEFQRQEKLPKKPADIHCGTFINYFFTAEVRLLKKIKIIWHLMAKCQT
jgi:hypothetical protein